VQARVEFFTKRVVNQALTRYAGKALERRRVQSEMIVGFPTRTRTRMARMQA